MTTPGLKTDGMKRPMQRRFSVHPNDFLGPRPRNSHTTAPPPAHEVDAGRAGRRWCMCPATGCRPGPAPVEL